MFFDGEYLQVLVTYHVEGDDSPYVRLVLETYEIRNGTEMHLKCQLTLNETEGKVLRPDKDDMGIHYFQQSQIATNANTLVLECKEGLVGFDLVTGILKF